MPIFASTPEPHDSLWGAPQTADQALPGIWSVETASHGGFILSDPRQAAMPAALRLDTRFYEEDCDWALAVLAFEREFAAAKQTLAGWVQLAHDTVRTWRPDAYAAFTGKPVAPSQSHILKEREAYRQRIGQVVVRSAFGSWAQWVPDGRTGVVGYVLEGVDHLAHPRFAAEAHWALCDAEIYRARSGPVSFAEIGAEACARPEGV